MSDVMPEPEEAPAAEGLAMPSFDVRTLGRRARENQVSGNALMAVGASLAVFAAALLLWAGIVAGPVRAILLLIAAAMMPLRLLINRVSALTRPDGVEGSTNSTLRRWLSHGEAGLLLLAGGFSAFGSGHDMGPVLGGACAGLIVLAGLWGPRPGYFRGLYPTFLLAATAAVSAFEPAWGWRGQSFLAGLSVIAAVLAVQVWRRWAPRTSA